ncbi:MAG: M15 family metallopeptidase [Lachnospiraceae bacterium]|nr:M15 family metallopeptidase [Lachnospiraceae bacterium]
MIISGCNGDITEDKISGKEYSATALTEKQEPVIQLKDYNDAGDPENGSEPEDIRKTGISAEVQSDSLAEDNAIGEEVNNMAENFYITEITDDIFDRIYGKSFKEDCTLPREELRYLHVLHKDINGEEHEGEMIVNKHIAEDVLDILKTLYENDYPIEKIRLVDEYGADDELSMEDNNSSCFNFRFVPRTKKISKHGMGMAVDINTLYNPYITTVNGRRNVDPVNAEPYADRDADFDYKIEKGDLCYNLFTGHGFTWGGEWKNSKDYQHFEIPDEKIKEFYPD